MTNRFDMLRQQFFQKNIVDCSVEELQNLANDYPYFAPAQYALLSKLKEVDHTAYQAQLQKAILFYHDPLAFDQFINSENYVMEFSSNEQQVEVNNAFKEAVEQEADVAFNADTESTHGINQAQEMEVVHASEAAINSQEGIAIEDKEIVSSGEKEKINTEAEFSVNSNDPYKERSEINTAQEKPVEEIKALAKEEKETTEQLAFEPYHTVDYFASQGIKLSQEEVTKDKLGKQLKSFTEWLKTMKKLPVAERVEPLDVHSEQNVENLAAHSVEREEIYTETMAEVWASQGNNEKAMEIYNKLSLLNPSKRAYFAAKIDTLK